MSLMVFNPLKLLINYALTKEMSDVILNDMINPNYKRWGFNLTFIIRPGEIKEIVGVKEVKSLFNVIDVVIAHDEGEIIGEEAIGTLQQVVLRVLGFAENRNELKKVINEIVSLINVYAVDNESMLLDVFDYQEL